MKKKIINILKYIFFLAIGIFVFLWVYREYNLNSFFKTLTQLKWSWILLSIILGLLSHFSRAIRWNMLIKTLNYSPKIINTFLSVIIMYATNLIIPRGGELARCSILSRYEKIPFGKLVGTVVTERATDMLIIILMLLISITSQLGIFKQFLANNPKLENNFKFLFSFNFWIVVFSLSVILLFLIWRFRHKLKKIKFIKKIFDLLFNFFEGIKSIKKLQRPVIYIIHSIFIHVMYFFMMYVVFLSYPPTQNISYLAGLTAFVMGGFAMIAPVQGGIGAWHFMIIETLFLYGLDREFGQNYALISHTSTNLAILIFGGICFIILPLVNIKTKAVRP